MYVVRYTIGENNSIYKKQYVVRSINDIPKRIIERSETGFYKIRNRFIGSIKETYH